MSKIFSSVGRDDQSSLKSTVIPKAPSGMNCQAEDACKPKNNLMLSDDPNTEIPEE